MADLIIRVHLISGVELDYPITLERPAETIKRNRQALEFDGWTPEALDSTDRDVIREVLVRLYGDSLRTGPGRGLSQRTPEDPGWHVPQAMFYLGGQERVTAIPARNIVAITILDPEARAGSRPGFVPREGDIAT